MGGDGGDEIGMETEERCISKNEEKNGKTKEKKRQKKNIGKNVPLLPLESDRAVRWVKRRRGRRRWASLHSHGRG